MKRRDFIRSIGAAGIISLAATVPVHGYGTGRSAEPRSGPLGKDSASEVGLKGPFDVAFDPTGNMVVTDPPSYRVVKLDASYQPQSSFGTPGAEAGKLNFPKGVAVDSQGLTYVVDSNNCRVQAFDASGNVKQVLGTVGQIGGAFATPQGIFIDGKGRILVADTRNHRVQIFEGNSVVAIIGELGDENDQFRLPTACAATSQGEILVLDSKHGLVKVFGEDLSYRRAFGGVGKEPGQLNLPQGMTLDGSEHVWVADTGNHRIQEFDLGGKLVSVVGKEGSGPDAFSQPTGIACRDGKVYVADNGNKRIQVFSKS